MSLKRVCPNCFREEKELRLNFGGNTEAEKEFHDQKWCDCDYSSPNEMMMDQDMGFENPEWIKFARFFLANYHLRLSQGHIENKEENVRFFLKLLKSSANNCRLSIDLVDLKKDENYESVYNGKSNHTPKSVIFKD